MASTKPREMARPETGAGTHLIGLLHAVELIEDVLEVVRRNPFAFVEDLQGDRSCSRQVRMNMVVPAAAYFAALSRRLNSTCSNNTASSDTIGTSVAEIELHGSDAAGF